MAYVIISSSVESHVEEYHKFTDSCLPLQWLSAVNRLNFIQNDDFQAFETVSRLSLILPNVKSNLICRNYNDFGFRIGDFGLFLS